MNTDRELLELAAKAAGIYAQWDCPDRGMMALTPDGFDTMSWNPLASDGDRYRLAIKLKLFGSEQLQNWVSSYILEGFSYEEAWKWAIVRAAAEIGRSMK